MELDFRRKETSVGIVIISAACCIPGMAPLDEQARRIVEQAISETGIMAQVKIMPATTARSALLAALAMPFFSRIFTAFSTSPSASIKAC